MTRRETILNKFEDTLLDGLQGVPLTNKEGVITAASGEVQMGPPDTAFLSVVRAYLKDTQPEQGKEKAPVTGKATGLLAQYEKTKQLPYGAKAN